MTYTLGPVKPHVANAANEIGPRFGVRTVYGFASRSYASDHPLGLALDFMTYSNTGMGNAVAAYAQANASRLGITYIIWNQRIWSVARSNEGWRVMSDRGSATANHKDHVHVSFSGAGATNVGFPGGPIIPPGINPLNPDGFNAPFGGAIPELIFNPNAWVRVAMFSIGLILLLIALRSVNTGNAPKVSAATAIDVVKKVSKK